MLFILKWHHICVPGNGLNAHTTKTHLNVVSPKASLSHTHTHERARTHTIAHNKMRKVLFFPVRFFRVVHAWLSMFFPTQSGFNVCLFAIWIAASAEKKTDCAV